MKIGIIGLPLSGKSTVFNALTGLSVQTKEFSDSSSKKASPNLGVVKVPDERLEKLTQVYSSKKTTYDVINFVDMQGVTKDTKLEDIDLSPIKDTDALVLVIRFFENKNVPHVYENVDGLRDLNMLATFIILSDLAIAENRITKMENDQKRGRKYNEKEYDVVKKCHQWLLQEKPLRLLSFSQEEDSFIRGFQFLSKKPTLALFNISESDIEKGHLQNLSDAAAALSMASISFCAKVEAELAQLDDEELKKSFMQELGIKETARDKFIHASFALLDLIIFYTAGEKESRAWFIKNGSSALVAAGKIHTDIQRGFIRAEVFNYNDFSGADFDEAKVKAKGLFRLEGKEYIFKDGDIVYFRFSV